MYPASRIDTIAASVIMGVWSLYTMKTNTVTPLVPSPLNTAAIIDNSLVGWVIPNQR